MICMTVCGQFWKFYSLLFFSHQWQTSMNVQQELTSVHTTVRTLLVATLAVAGLVTGWLQMAAHAMVS